MLQIKLGRVWWVLLLAIALAYPASAWAVVTAEQVGMASLPPPFTPDWVGIWVFAIAGGVGASFIEIEEIDKHIKLKSRPFAKIIFGTGGGMAISSAIGTLSDTPLGAISLFAFIASVLSALICIGFSVYIGNQRRQNEVYDMGRDMVTGRIFGRKSKSEDNNEPS